MAFRFVHTADIHLDSPLRTLALREPELAGLIGGATRKAFVAIVDLCLAEQVDALMIAGDLYDGEQTSMKTARFLADQLRRLHQAGIAVFIIRGNHDAESRITRELTLPELVKVFAGRAEAVVLRRGGLDVAVHGVSFAQKHAPESLLSRFRGPCTRARSMSACCTPVSAGRPRTTSYAPCQPAELHGAGFDYWALGHIHQRFEERGRATIVMPGNPQGRDVNEAGPKTATLVTIADDGAISLEERPTSVAEFQRVSVDLAGVEDWRAALKRIETAFGAARLSAKSEHLVARLKLRGATPLAFRLRSDADKLREDVAGLGAAVGKTWIDKIELSCVEPSASGAAPSSDPVAELRALMEREVAQSRAFQDASARHGRGPQRPSAAGIAQGPVRPRHGGIRSNPSRRGERGRRGRARASPRRRQGSAVVRIARLDLARYGRFSDYVIDFGAAPPDGSDFHIVYGLNEAGKSTAAAAILDLLFGIEKQSAYGAAEVRTNWHAYSAMRIGARLELAGGAHEVARIKRDKHSLVDADNRPLDETLIKAELAGVDRAAFRMMFSLDDDSLEKGGEAILESRGDLGQLLFSASAGLAEMSGRLDGLRETADRFFRPRAKSTELAEKKRALEALKEERDKADTLASTYAELTRQRDEAKAAYESAARALSERRSRAETIRRLVAGLPHLAALSDAEGRLAPLAKLPTPPEGWRERLADLQTEAIRLTTQKENAETAVRALKEELVRVGEDAPALQVAARVDGWRELRSRYDSAKDIPVRRGELESKRNAVAEILSRLGRAGEAEPAKLLLSVRTVGALEDLIAERSGVLTKLEGARAALDEASRAEAEALDWAPQCESRGADFNVLKARLQAARRDESASRLRALREELQRQGRKFADALAALAPWRGDPESLALVSVPGEAEIAALRQRRSQANAARQSALDRLADKVGEADRTQGRGDRGRARGQTLRRRRRCGLAGGKRGCVVRSPRSAQCFVRRRVRGVDAPRRRSRRDPPCQCP